MSGNEGSSAGSPPSGFDLATIKGLVETGALDEIVGSSPLVKQLHERLSGMETEGRTLGAAISQVSQQLNQLFEQLKEAQANTAEVAAMEPASPLGGLLLQLIKGATAPREQAPGDGGFAAALKMMAEMMKVINDIQTAGATSAATLVNTYTRALKGGLVEKVDAVPAREPVHVHLQED